MNMRVGLLASLATSANGLIACAFRCDLHWPGLDTGRCFEGDTCPDPMDTVVTDDICWGLLFKPSPGDILLHDAVLFQDAQDCRSYINVWENKASLAARKRMYTRLTARNITGTHAYISSPEFGEALNASESGEQDLISFVERGATWDALTQGALSKCVGIGGKAAETCKSWDTLLAEGMDGQQTLECLQHCAAMIGIDVLEKAVCAWATTHLGGAAYVTTICGALSKKLGPLNAWLDKNVVSPVVKAAATVTDALYSTGKAIGHFFNFW